MVRGCGLDSCGSG